MKNEAFVHLEEDGMKMCVGFRQRKGIAGELSRSLEHKAELASMTATRAIVSRNLQIHLAHSSIPVSADEVR